MLYIAFCILHGTLICILYTLLIIIINIKSSKKYTKLGKFYGIKLPPFDAYNARKF